jgi:hypothetical protein
MAKQLRMASVKLGELGDWEPMSSGWRRNVYDLVNNVIAKRSIVFCPTDEISLETTGEPRDVKQLLMNKMRERVHPDYWKYIIITSYIEGEPGPDWGHRITRCTYKYRFPKE